jgi:EmrB/QacA subfamily drug resistance transporter
MVKSEQRVMRPGWVLAAVCLSVVIISLDTTIVNVALAPISEDLGASTTQLQWVPDAYLVVYAGLLLLAGAVGDRIGHKRVLVAGLLLFGVGSVLAAASTTVDLLIVWRVLMGLGAAAIMPASLATLNATFPADRRAQALGFWSAAAGAGVAAGPIVGGALIAAWHWQAIFLVNIPLVVVSVLADILIVKETPRRKRSLDVAGALLATAAIIAVTAAIIQSPSWGWLDGRTLALYAAAAVALVLFLVRQHTTREPLVALRWLRDRHLAVPSVVAGGLFFALTGASFVLMLYLQLVLGYSVLAAGAAILPAVAVTTVVAPIAGSLVNRVGARLLMTVGMFFLAGGLAVFATLTATSSYWPILGGGLLFGAGIGLPLTPATDAVIGSKAGRISPGIASGIIETVEEVASALGIAVIGAIVTSGFAADLTGQSAAINHAAANSLAAAVQTAHGYAPHVLVQVRVAFTHAMDLGLWIAAATAAAVAIVAAVAMPSRHRLRDTPTMPAEPEDSITS